MRVFAMDSLVAILLITPLFRPARAALHRDVLWHTAQGFSGKNTGRPLFCTHNANTPRTTPPWPQLQSAAFALQRPAMRSPESGKLIECCARTAARAAPHGICLTINPRLPHPRSIAQHHHHNLATLGAAHAPQPVRLAVAPITRIHTQAPNSTTLTYQTLVAVHVPQARGAPHSVRLAVASIGRVHAPAPKSTPVTYQKP